MTLFATLSVLIMTGLEDDSPVSLTIYGAAHSFGPHNPDFKAVDIKYSASSQSLQYFHPVVPPIQFGNDEPLPEVNICKTFIRPKVMISGQEVEMFCGVIGNQNKAYKLAHMSAIKAPMDFAIVTSCCFTNFKNTFETVDEPDYAVKLLDDAAVGAVQLKEWLAWEAESQPVKAGVTLVFHICSQVTFKDKTSYHNVCTTRDVFLCDQLKCLKKVGCPKGNQWCQRWTIRIYFVPHLIILFSICVQQGKLCARLCSDDRDDITLEPGITSLLECFGDLVSGPDDTALVVSSLPISTLNVSHQVTIALDPLM
ncbi:hypothetical protein J3A83DRAFT_4185728 [Scleroderma citrinum]